IYYLYFFFFSSRRRHTRSDRDWSSDVCSSDLKDNKTSIVIHAGDYVSPDAIRVFQGVKLVGVFGNNDFDKSGIKEAFSDIGGQRSEERRVGKECRSRWWQYH